MGADRAAGNGGEMNRVTDQTRNDVWYSMLDTDRMGRYYGAMTDRYHRYTVVARLVVAGSAMAGVVSFVASLPSYAQITFGLVIAIAVILDLVVDFQKKAAVLHTIAVGMDQVSAEWQDLWGRIERIDEDAARERILELNRQLNSITARTGDIGVAVDRRLNEKCAEATYTVYRQQYGLSG